MKNLKGPLDNFIRTKLRDLETFNVNLNTKFIKGMF